MRVASYDIVFQEIPDEVTLALNISGCPCHCAGCHSPHLWEDTGELLTTDMMDGLLARYGSSITCVAFMGGDGDPAEVARWAQYIHGAGKKTAWYSGRREQSPLVPTECLDYIKLGPYIESLGGLKSPTSNQHLYRILHPHNELEDITYRFRR